MNRRAFFGTMIGGIATAAAVRTWPFRVFSFASNPHLPADYIARLERFGYIPWDPVRECWYFTPEQMDAGEYLGLSRAEYPGRLVLPDPIASPLENFKPDRRFTWRQLLKGA